jgi:hypothetical protein
MLVSHRYERASLIVTSNTPSARTAPAAMSLVSNTIASLAGADTSIAAFDPTTIYPTAELRRRRRER